MIKSSYKIDLNCDLGEGAGNDAELMQLISSCSIACGGHAGDEETMRSTIQLAKHHGVKVGAHPSFPDRANFGREIMNIDERDLAESISDQVERFLNACAQNEVEMNHLKLHGALYNCAAKDVAMAELVLDVLKPFGNHFSIYAPFGSVLAEKGSKFYPIVHEAFVDRRYNPDLSLVSRTHPQAIISHFDEAWTQFLSIVKDGKVPVLESDFAEIQAQTFCVHGDSEHTLSLLRGLRGRMKGHAISIE
jgi:5-oxoprolinase (ATP-hydrolysing) subunit A